MKAENQPMAKDLIAQHNLTDEECDLVSSWGRRDGEKPLKTLL
jgi:hypothetical protein